MLYTTWGSVRGCCGHAHRSLEAAGACVERDQHDCAGQGGYSDRGIRVFEHPDELHTYDVQRGPGRPANTSDLD